MELYLILCLEKNQNLSVKLIPLKQDSVIATKWWYYCFSEHLKTIFSRHIVNRDYKHFNQNEFLHELELEINKGNFYNSDKPDDFSNLFKAIIDKHAPIRQKKVRGKNTPFITKGLRKALMDRSRLQSKYKISF